MAANGGLLERRSSVRRSGSTVKEEPAEDHGTGPSGK